MTTTEDPTTPIHPGSPGTVTPQRRRSRMNESRDLTREECRELLEAAHVARVAVVTTEGPHIVPVNFVVFEDSAVVRTSSYSVLGTYARDAVVALEVDGFDLERRAGWSVVVRGRCQVETDPRTIVAIRRAFPDAPWAGGTRNLHLRIPLADLSGRAVGDLTPTATPRSLAGLSAEAERASVEA